MSISAITGNSTSTQTGSQSYSSQIKQLERQKQQIQKKLNEVNNDDALSDEQKQQQMVAYQTQIQTIETQIQQLEKKQQEQQAGKKNNTNKASEVTDSLEEEADANAVVDIKI